MEECIRIYEQAFGTDEKDFTDALFKTCFKYCKVLKENNEICSMLFLLPATLKIGERQIDAEYLFAAATDEKYRGKGCMSRLINSVKGNEPIFLKPANEGLVSFYERLGFKCVKATKARNKELCLIPEKEFYSLSKGTEYKNEEYTLMYYSKEELILNAISFPFTME